MSDVSRLRELLAKAHPGEWKSIDDPNNSSTEIIWERRDTGLTPVARVPKHQGEAALIVAMHEALPEHIQAMELLSEAFVWGQVHHTGCPRAHCECGLDAWRDRVRALLSGDTP